MNKPPASVREFVEIVADLVSLGALRVDRRPALDRAGELLTTCTLLALVRAAEAGGDADDRAAAQRWLDLGGKQLLDVADRPEMPTHGQWRGEHWPGKAGT